MSGFFFTSKLVTEFEDEQRRMKHRSEQHRAAASKLGGFEIINVACTKQKNPNLTPVGEGSDLFYLVL